MEKATKYHGNDIFYHIMYIIWLLFFSQEMKCSLKLWQLLSSLSPHAFPLLRSSRNWRPTWCANKCSCAQRKTHSIPRGSIPLRGTTMQNSVSREQGKWRSHQEHITDNESDRSGGKCLSCNFSFKQTA